MCLSVQAQELTLPVYHLTIAQQDLDALLANPWADITYPAMMEFEGAGYPCRVRFRGATGRDLPKKSWKVYFEDEGPLGWEETNLNAEYRDRSLIRNALCMELARRSGIPTPDTRFVSMTVNGEYWGVYLEIESIDGDFFERRALINHALFKSISHACRFAPPFEPDRLTEYYEPKSSAAGMVDTLAARCVFIAESDPAAFAAGIEELVDVENVLTYFAIMYAARNGDGYTKNFYIAEDENRIYRLLPWDCDATLGNDWTGEFVNEAEFTEPGALTYQGLFQRLISVPDYLTYFQAQVDTIIHAGFDSLEIVAAGIHDEIRNDAYQDTLKRGTNADFDTALSDLLDFISGRRAALESMGPIVRIDVGDFSPTDDHLGVVGEPMFFSAQIAGAVEQAHAVLLNESGLDFWVALNDAGVNGDPVAGDGYYSRVVSLPGAYPQFYYAYRVVPEGSEWVSYNPAAGNLNHWAYPLHLPVIGYDSAPTSAEHVEILDAVITSDGATHGVILHNIAGRNIQLSGYVVRLGSSSRMGRISREHHLLPDQSLVFTNHPEIMEYYKGGEVIAGGFYFPVQDGDTVILETSSGDVLLSRIIQQPTILDDEAGEVVINEINYNSAEDFDPGDWIELHAPGNAISLFNWILRDQDDAHGFTFPLEAIIPTNGYLVVAEDVDAFEERFPEVENVLGSLDFGFAGSGDAVRLFSAGGVEIDNVIYNDDPPWPEAPDGGGPTLELINPFVDNTDPQFWRASTPAAPHGSPGSMNSVYTDADDHPEPAVPQTWEILSVYPNPFNQETNIVFQAPRPQQTAITIYDLLGRVTQRIPIEAIAGYNTVSWNAAAAASGVYFIQLGKPASAAAYKVVLLR